ncbi:MAG TPA: MgtC/SapB family protein [Terrimicrobiaceae bacterium]|jgi:putative Mg2+ transporter-C (MgtC) family protein
MQIELSSSDVAVRLLLTFIAGAVIGVNRGERGRPAGLRTTILVCLTASASMILGNLMLSTSGRRLDSFVTMDVMRLPLGILTGMGFIGAGAILHRGNAITGVTTAATLWFTTLMGFCFGAGEFLLGTWMLGLGVLVLWLMEWVEARWKQRQEATLMVLVAPGGPSQSELAASVEADGHRVTSSAAKYSDAGNEWRFDVNWRASAQDNSPPQFVKQLASRSGVKEVRWSPSLKP